VSCPPPVHLARAPRCIVSTCVFYAPVRHPPYLCGIFPRTFWVWVSGVRHVTIGGGFSVFGIGHEMKVGRGRRGEGSRGRVVSLSVPYRWLDWMGLAVGSEGYECTPLWRREGDGALANLYLLSLPISWPEITALECRGGVCCQCGMV